MSDEIPTIAIDFDKKCKACGKQGVCQNGLCLPCNTKRVKNLLKSGKGAVSMGKEKEKVESQKVDIKSLSLEAAEKELLAVLRENWDGAWRKMQEAYTKFDSGDGKAPKKFTYPVGLKVNLRPMGTSMKVWASTSFGVREKDETIGEIVDTSPRLL